MLYLKISPLKRVMRFGKKEKLCSQYMGPYEVFQWVVKVAYELRLPGKLGLVHPVFHVCMLKKLISDPVSILHIEGLGVDESLSKKRLRWKF